MPPCDHCGQDDLRLLPGPSHLLECLLPACARAAHPPAPAGQRAAGDPKADRGTAAREPQSISSPSFAAAPESMLVAAVPSAVVAAGPAARAGAADRKSTRLNSSHVAISYAVFCL